jgi:hypothetical protein
MTTGGRMEVGMRLFALFLDGNVMSRAARERRRQLESDIECFATPAERQDLFDALGRYPDADTDELRELMDREFARAQFEFRFGHAHLPVFSFSR